MSAAEPLRPSANEPSAPALELERGQGRVPEFERTPTRTAAAAQRILLPTALPPAWELGAAPHKPLMRSKPLLKNGADDVNWYEVAEKRVVWILGAGFSVPLGGPLFRALISEESLATLRNWPEYADQSWNCPDGSVVRQLPAGLAARCVQQLYKAGVNGNSALPLWSDAEQFLERLEIAANEPGSPLAKAIVERLGSVVAPGASNDFSAAIRTFRTENGLALLHTEAIRFVAGVCTAFLLRAEQTPSVVKESEQWEPYRRWVETLVSGSDSVITFNYDRALEVLGEHARCTSGSTRFRHAIDMPHEKFRQLRRMSVPVFHLHGHVGWKLSADGKLAGARSSDEIPLYPAVAHVNPGAAVIGVPGKRKTGFPSDLLQGLWELAMGEIRNASAVVFVGYRFPETDNMAKRLLCDTLRENQMAHVHTVLGAANSDTPRLKGMIEWTRMQHRGENTVHVHELWAQDFLAVFDRDYL